MSQSGDYGLAFDIATLRAEATDITLEFGCFCLVISRKCFRSK